MIKLMKSLISKLIFYESNIHLNTDTSKNLNFFFFENYITSFSELYVLGLSSKLDPQITDSPKTVYAYSFGLALAMLVTLCCNPVAMEKLLTALLTLIS